MNRIAGRSLASSELKKITLSCNPVHSARLSQGASIPLARLPRAVSSVIRIRRQILEQLKELWRLAAEEPHGR